MQVAAAQLEVHLQKGLKSLYTLHGDEPLLVAELVEWRADEEYDRLGLDDRFFTILDVEVALITVPVRPGRNMGVIVEAAARNELLKSMGKHSALELQERLVRELARGHVKSDVE